MTLMDQVAVPARAGRAGRRILVIGGGASGVLMAVHLLRADRRVRVTLLERNGLLGCGVAYGTRDANHLLNTRVSSMSAFPDDPHHFLRWLRDRGEPDAYPYAFVRRALYGHYMADLLTPWREDHRLACLQAECIEVREEGSGIRAVLADGGTIDADGAVLATGHLLPAAHGGGADLLTRPWSDDPVPDRSGRVLIVGSGLTMVDQVLSLLAAGHEGEILAVSRRGLMPRPHADVAPDPIGEADLPRDARIRSILRWLRRRVRAHEAAGGNWRSVVDGLRPQVQRLWQTLPRAERARFLRQPALGGRSIATACRRVPPRRSAPPRRPANSCCGRPRSSAHRATRTAPSASACGQREAPPRRRSQPCA